MQSESEILIGTKFMDLGVGGGWCFKYFLNLRNILRSPTPRKVFKSAHGVKVFMYVNVHAVYCAFVAMAIEQI